MQPFDLAVLALVFQLGEQAVRGKVVIHFDEPVLPLLIDGKIDADLGGVAVFVKVGGNPVAGLNQAAHHSPHFLGFDGF